MLKQYFIKSDQIYSYKFINYMKLMKGVASFENFICPRMLTDL